MPKLKHRVPSYRLHNRSGQAVVTLNGKDHYLGRYESPESREEYARLVAQWLSINRQMPLQSDKSHITADDLTISELILAYLQFAEQYYRKNGRPSGEFEPIRQSMKPLAKLFAGTLVNEFGPIRLKAVREEMINADLCRNVVNARVKRIRRMFKWGVENQIVDSVRLEICKCGSGPELWRSRPAKIASPPLWRPGSASTSFDFVREKQARRHRLSSRRWTFTES